MLMMIADPNEQAHDDYDDDEPTTEQLIKMLRESLRDVEEGRTYPFEEVLAEIREKRAATNDMVSSVDGQI